MQKLKNIFQQFNCNGEFKAFTTLNSGHINDTYLIETASSEAPDYVLQRLNHQVFPNIPELMNNKVMVAEHMENSKDNQYINLKFYRTNLGLYYYQDKEGNYWNLMDNIPDSKVLDKTENTQQAEEAGKAFGGFIDLLDDFDASKLYEVIKDFHKMSFRYQQFDKALKEAGEERKKKAAIWIEQVLESRDEMQKLEKLHEQGKIPLRVTHNDTKLSNILFDAHDKALAVIDWDTLMPGIVHYDFGDSVRTICSTATEDEQDLNKVKFNLDYYQAFRKGFLSKLKDKLSDLEIHHLPIAAQTITFIMGLRFITDYLNGDVYYKIKYPEHNLNRAANQFTLVKRMGEVLQV
ncbi:MAG: phosphotransferase [Bacteroidales bacterium]|nr:phosphotransferase [Bacteroidales bacterium]